MLQQIFDNITDVFPAHRHFFHICLPRKSRDKNGAAAQARACSQEVIEQLPAEQRSSSPPTLPHVSAVTLEAAEPFHSVHSYARFLQLLRFS